eukprot:9167853-Pyramimonas_sp.AAC.1
MPIRIPTHQDLSPAGAHRLAGGRRQDWTPGRGQQRSCLPRRWLRVLFAAQFHSPGPLVVHCGYSRGFHEQGLGAAQDLAVREGQEAQGADQRLGRCQEGR